MTSGKTSVSQRTTRASWVTARALNYSIGALATPRKRLRNLASVDNAKPFSDWIKPERSPKITKVNEGTVLRDQDYRKGGTVRKIPSYMLY